MFLIEPTESSNILQEQLCKGIPHPTRGPEIIHVSIILTAITFSTVALRCASRYLVAHKFWWDDWMIISAAILLVPISVFTFLFPHYGLGKHIWNIPPLNTILLRKVWYIVQIIYVFVLSLAKISILCFYLRVIPGDRFARISKICIVWMACHFLGFLMAVVMQCVPINALWNTDLKGKCVDSQALGFAGAGASIFEDVVLILLPISELRTLTLDWKKKAVVMLMFALGSFACIASIIRLKFMFNYNYGSSPDVTWQQIDVIIWSEIEVFVAVMCACLITLRALLVKYFPSLFTVDRAREPRSDSTLPSWRVRRSSRIATNLGYAPNVVELSDIEDAQMVQIPGQVMDEKNDERLRIKAKPRSRESLEIAEIMA